LFLSGRREQSFSEAACLATIQFPSANRIQRKRDFVALGLLGVALDLSTASASALANRYRDNPDRAVNQRVESWSSPVVRLETGRQVSVDGVHGIFKGTGFLVSPCYVVTAAHVVSPDRDALLDGVIDPHTDFRMVLRAKGQNSNATVNIISDIDRRLNDLKLSYLKSSRGLINQPVGRDSKDFIFLRLSDGQCIGSSLSFGWYEASNHDLQTGGLAAALGYPKGERKGELHLGTGRIGEMTRSGLLEYSGSYKIGESGGPLLVVDDGRLKVAGLILSHRGSNASQEYPTYSSDSANEVLSLVPILNYPPIKAVLDADKARFGNRNPAALRQATSELPK